MTEPTIKEGINLTERMRNLKPGDQPIIEDIKYHKSFETIRVRETKVSGAQYSIKKNKKLGTVSVYCISKPAFYSPHGITVQAEFMADDAPIFETHELKVYTGDEVIIAYKTDGSFRAEYNSFDEFLSNWKVI